MKNIYISSCSKNGGVYHYNLNSDGKLEFIDKLDADSPMYHIEDNGKMYILLRSPFENSPDSGLISADIDNYSLIGKTEPVSTKGLVACHLCKENDDIYCVNYSSGSVIKMPDKLITHKGCGINPERQEMAHTHYVAVTPDKKYVLVTDLGLDKIFVYDRNLNFVREVSAPLGHGVRHLVFGEKYLFAANELESTVSAYEYADGNLTLIDTASILPNGCDVKSIAAAIRIHNGFIYASNRGHDSLAKLSFDGKKLYLEALYPCGGKEPRDFDFFGEFVIFTNIADNSVTVFKESDRGLILTDRVELEQPLCVSEVILKEAEQY